MLTFVSRNEALKILGCSLSKFLRDERDGKFRRFPARRPDTKINPGRPVEWEYDEAELRTLAERRQGERQRERRQGRPRKTTTSQTDRRVMAYQLFGEGCSIYEVVVQTRLDPEEVGALHELYIIQANLLVIPGDLILELERLRFRVRDDPAKFVETVRYMVDVIVGRRPMRDVTVHVGSSTTEPT